MNSVNDTSNVDYISVWKLEETLLDVEGWRNGFDRNPFFSIYISMLYIASAFGGQYLMKKRQPFAIRNVLCIWNMMLAILSVVGFMRTVPELIYILKQDNGFHYSVCRR